MSNYSIDPNAGKQFSDAQGQYLLPAVEAGVRTVFVWAQGFQPATQTVTLNQPGAAQTLDVVLTRSP